MSDFLSVGGSMTKKWPKQVRPEGVEPPTLRSEVLGGIEFYGALGNSVCPRHHFFHVDGKILVRFLILVIRTLLMFCGVCWYAHLGTAELLSPVEKIDIQ